MLFQHDPDEPIGVWHSIVETPKGLKVSGQIAANTGKGREVLELMRAGAIDGLSIGFKTVRSRQDPVSKIRKIIEADLWEISVVTFPMQENARVDTVKGRSPQPGRAQNTRPSIREFERWLVRDAGLSRNDARLVVTKGYRHAMSQRDAVLGTNALAERIRQSALALSTRTYRNYNRIKP
jgi:HK97 family phage prohead protease